MGKYTTSRFTVIVLAAFIALLPGKKLLAEYVFLKDGSIVECKILEETPNAVTTRLNDGRSVVYARNNVLRVLYTKLYMGKVYINRTDGKVIEAYIVDEDQENYTVRMDITKPEEFTIKRTDVLFMARKNPTGLGGKISQKQVDLSWNPPYNPVKRYKIYVKPKGGEYRAVGESGSTRYTVTGLNCNMEYYAMVTAIDRDNYESLPSNEFTILTLKARPVPPRKLRIAKMTSDQKQVYTALLEWDKAEDPCGGIINDYQIYLKAVEVKTSDRRVKETAQAREDTGKTPTGYKPIGRSAGNSFQIQGLNDYTTYSAIVTSIDNTKDESDPSKELTFDTGITRPLYPYPVMCDKEFSRDQKELTAIISWKEVYDPFRRIVAYRVFQKEGKEFKLAGATDKAEYEVKGLSPSQKHYFKVRAVDVRGVESEDSYLVSTGLVRYVDISARVGCLMPLRDFAKLYKPGYGVSLSASVESLFLNNMVMGIETGYSHLSGKTDKSKYASIIPFMLNLGYRFQLGRWLSLDPKISLGAAYHIASYNTFVTGAIEQYLTAPYAEKKTVEFIFSAGLNCTFIIKKLVLLRVGAEYSGIVEKKGFMDYVFLSCGVGVWF